MRWEFSVPQCEMDGKAICVLNSATECSTAALETSSIHAWLCGVTGNPIQLWCPRNVVNAIVPLTLCRVWVAFPSNGSNRSRRATRKANTRHAAREILRSSSLKWVGGGGDVGPRSTTATGIDNSPHIVFGRHQHWPFPPSLPSTNKTALLRLTPFPPTTPLHCLGR